MRIEVNGDGERLSIRIDVDWQRFSAFVKAVIATVTLLLSLYPLLVRFFN